LQKEVILVLGAGSFGTCLAEHLSRKGLSILIWDIEQKVCNDINNNKENNRYFPDIKLNQNIRAEHDLSKINFDPIDFIVNAIPTQYTRSVYKKLESSLHRDTIIINASKGIENGTLALPQEIIKAEFGENIYLNSCVLSGPSFAVEVLNMQPTAVSIAGLQKNSLLKAQKLFHTPYFRAYSNNDPKGLELCGALKNVIAIAVGALGGLGYQQNTKAALITRGLNEISRFGEKLGAKKSTFLSLGGMGDLVLTCSSDKSRNYRIGYYMGKGLQLTEAISKTGTTAEGITTAISAYELAKKHNIDAPICSEVYKVLHKNKPIKKAFEDILNREMKSEF